MWWLLIFLSTIVLAQPGAVQTPTFPDDTRDPNVAGGAELIEAVCPGHAVIGQEIRCDGPCSAYTTAPESWVGQWTLTRVVRGHFLSPDTDDVVLAISGCEPHSENWGGSILLTHRTGEWVKLWYKAGVPTDQCHKISLESRRQILVCLGGFGGQGNITDALYVEDLLAPKAALMAASDNFIFAASDNLGSCGYNDENRSKPFPIVLDHIERVVFVDAPNGTLMRLSIYGHRGERNMSPREVEQCTQNMTPGAEHLGISFNPPTKPYRADFTFDGTNFKRAAAR